MAAGSILIDLLLRTGSFSTDTDRAAKDLAKLKREAYQTGKAIGDSVKNIAGMLGIGFSVAGLVSVTKGAIDAADRLNDLSKSTGVAVDTLGGFGYAAKQSGSDLDGAAAAIGKLNLKMAEFRRGDKETVKLFEAMGLDDLIKRGASVDELFIALANNFESYAEGPEKAALGNAIWSKSYDKVLPLLSEGGKKLVENVEYFKRYGGVTKQTAEDADKFNDTLEKLTLLQGAFGRTVAAELITPMTNVLALMIKNEEQGKRFASVGQSVAAVIKGMATTFVFFAMTLEGTADRIGAFAAQLGLLHEAAEAAKAKSGPLDIFGSGSYFEELKKRLPQIKAIGDAARAQGDANRKAFQDFRDAMYGGPAATGSPAAAADPTASAAALAGTADPRIGPPRPPTKAPGIPGSDPAKGDPDKKAKAALDAEIQAIRDFGQQRVEAYEFANKYVESVYADGLTSLRETLDMQRNLREAALQAEKDALDEEIDALLGQANDNSLKPETKAAAADKIPEAVAKRAALEKKAAQDAALNARMEASALKVVKDGYDELRAKVLELGGDMAGASKLRADNDIEAARNLIKAAGGTKEEGDKYAALVAKKTQLSDLQRDYNSLLESARVEEEAILLNAEMSGLSETETLRAVGAARETALKQLGDMAAKARELADTLKTPEANSFADQLANGFKRAALEVDPLLAKVRDLAKEAGDSIASNFERAAFEGKGLRGALKGIADDMTRLLTRKLVTEPLSKAITDKLGGTGTDGGLWGGLLGRKEAKPGEAGPQADKSSASVASSLTTLQTQGIDPATAALGRLAQAADAVSGRSGALGATGAPGEPGSPAVGGIPAPSSGGGVTAGDDAVIAMFQEPADSAIGLKQGLLDTRTEVEKFGAIVPKLSSTMETFGLATGKAGSALQLLPTIISMFKGADGGGGLGSLLSSIGSMFSGPAKGINGGAMLPNSLRGGADGGTNQLERDMITLVHKGEAIVPKAYNPALPGNMAAGAKPNITIENHGARVEKRSESNGDVRLIIDAAVAEVDRRIASGTGSTASALKSRGLSLSGSLPRRA